MKQKNFQLLNEIDSFLGLVGMGPSYFGKKSVGNSEIVSRLRSGGRVWPDTEKRIREFMAAESEKHKRVRVLP